MKTIAETMLDTLNDTDSAFDQILATLAACEPWGKNDIVRQQLFDFVGQRREENWSVITKATKEIA